MRFRPFQIILITLGFSSIFLSPLAGAEEPIDPAVFAILQDHCLKCHGDKKTSGRLDLRSLPSILRGGKRGPVLVPGNAGDSRLVQLVRPGAKPHMPPGDKQLSPDEIARLEAWVATVQLDATSQQRSATDSNGQQPVGSRAAASHVTDPEMPATRLAATNVLVPPGVDPTLAIDLFVASRWRDRAVNVNDRCDDAAFARRLYLDLTGRIPTVDQLNGFCADTNSDKRRELIDGLLATDLYASHMADVFDVVLLGRRGERAIERRRQHGWRAYLESAFAENRPWNQMAREMVLARAAEQADVRAGWFLYGARITIRTLPRRCRQAFSASGSNVHSATIIHWPPKSNNDIIGAWWRSLIVARTRIRTAVPGWLSRRSVAFKSSRIWAARRSTHP